MPTEPDSPATAAASSRELLLEAAARLFAERGRDRVSIREIAAAAGVRHGGVNYHFRSKEELYQEALMRFGPPAHAPRPPLDEMNAVQSPEDARSLFMRVVEDLVRQVARPLDPIAAGLLHGELSRREGPDDRLFEEVIRPRHGAMARLIGRMCPHITDERELAVAAFNVVSQVLFLRVARPIALRLLGAEDFDEELAGIVARRIVETTLHGILAPAGEES